MTRPRPALQTQPDTGPSPVPNGSPVGLDPIQPYKDGDAINTTYLKVGSRFFIILQYILERESKRKSISITIRSYQHCVIIFFEIVVVEDDVYVSNDEF